jgi:hypothetical protein
LKTIVKNRKGYQTVMCNVAVLWSRQEPETATTSGTGEFVRFEVFMVMTMKNGCILGCDAMWLL